jgi:hypothetical protein
VYPGPLPRNPTLKILKHQLREEYSQKPWRHVSMAQTTIFHNPH